MNIPEPLLTPAANVQVSTTGHKLPEQTQVSRIVVPRPISISNLIYQWQPMGIRVVIDLPFTGNDQDFLFLIRNGPFIPYWSLDYSVSKPDLGPKNQPEAGWPTNYRQFLWNNARNVLHGFKSAQDFPQNYGIHISYYDLPSILSTMALSFRRWRGDLQYRIRTVAGFATQGYVFLGQLKNYFQPIAIYDEYNQHAGVQRQDASYRECMQNSYVLGDTSMFRHFEITVPYEYPVPWYDQYAWINRRISPHRYITPAGDPAPSAPITLEPHGDNFIAMGVRGNLAAAQTGAQIAFELEYRAVEGFQFADPFLLPKDFAETHKTLLINDFDKVKTVPDPTLKSDGISKITKVQSSRLKRMLLPESVIVDANKTVPTSSYSSREREFSY